MPTAEEIERIHSEAQESGYAAGHAAGYETGLANGRDEGYAEGVARGREESTRLEALMQELAQALSQSDQQLADQLLTLAVELASQVLRHSLRIQPELILPVVREAIATLPAHHGHPLLFLNPDDAALVRSHLGEQLSHNAWRIVEDAAITAGGCRIEIGASEVDATLQSRFRRVIDTIGARSDWLAPPR
ncbi:flagellar assembly protein FliH [Rhodocyclus tenuis]|uniref:Flagellar assembly protein FliH n=1 Tax=Rhodocyclus tenuis TaxID=1066 RepID=A0A840G6U6_RHOTE|nr:flagellar assembly protein FliH [Rhodocyclus tenuis]MBB4246680.1 flagellar assembly protein FliH [Rhodocyclus tenuis]